jgi:hypothetical protein
MSQWDVVVTGIDPERGRDAVVQAVAARLEADPARVARILTHAPAVLVTDVGDVEAKALVMELRALGLRVKPRPVGEPLNELSRSSMPSASAPAPATRASTRPQLASTPPPGAQIPRAAPVPIDLLASVGHDPGHAPPLDDTDSRRSPLDEVDVSSIPPPSGLELDLPLPPDVRRSAPPARAVDDRPEAMLRGLRTDEQGEAPVHAHAPLAGPPEEAPRVFWSALPGAFLVPLQRAVVGGLMLTPVCAFVAVVAATVGTFLLMLGLGVSLVASAAFMGIVMQVSHRCLWTTAVGEREPSSMSWSFLSDYVFPGIGMIAVQGGIGFLMNWGALWLTAQGAPRAVVMLLGLLAGLYFVIGFALSAANNSPMGYLDVGRIVRILARAPLEVLAIAAIGVLVQGVIAAVAVGQLGAAIASGNIGSTFLSVGGTIGLLSLGGAYGAALSATMMGMLFYARPEVAN